MMLLLASFQCRILFPGGGAYFDTPGGYAEAGGKLYEQAMRMNVAGDFFPVMGISLGFQLLTYLASDKAEHRASCHSYDEALPLEFKRGKRVRHTFSSPAV
jgi:gamma-glutamyl hydrolase/beta-1,4-mannosyltransferase